MEIKKAPELAALEKKFSWLETGGQWRPKNCTAKHKLALVVPFRDREEHLGLFLQHMHNFLRRQLLDYRIFIVEQNDTHPFNRAMLMNVGFVEANKLDNFDYYIFHDVDLLPEDERNIYAYPEQPRHMSVAIKKLNYK